VSDGKDTAVTASKTKKRRNRASDRQIVYSTGLTKLLTNGIFGREKEQLPKKRYLQTIRKVAQSGDGSEHNTTPKVARTGRPCLTLSRLVEPAKLGPAGGCDNKHNG